MSSYNLQSIIYSSSFSLMITKPNLKYIWKAGYTVHVISDCVTSYDLKKVDEMLDYYAKKGCEVKTLSEYMNWLRTDQCGNACYNPWTNIQQSCTYRVWLLFHVTNKAPEIWEYYPLLIVSFPYLWGIIKGKSVRYVDYSLINEYNIREIDGG